MILGVVTNLTVHFLLVVIISAILVQEHLNTLKFIMPVLRVSLILRYRATLVMVTMLMVMVTMVMVTMLIVMVTMLMVMVMVTMLIVMVMVTMVMVIVIIIYMLLF